MDEIQKENLPTKKGFWQNEVVIFLLGPILFLILVRFTGYQIFYHPNDKGNARLKFVLLLSGGALFYVACIVILFSTSE
jgi:hypothetical protein